MVSQLTQTTRHFATSQLEAERILQKAKEEHGSYIKQHIIAKRMKKDFEYFLVTITYEFCKVNDLLADD